MAVSLTKGQKISLAKEAGAPLTKVMMGLGWDPVSPSSGDDDDNDIDLDASCVVFDEGGQMIDAVWFRQLQSKDGSIVHTGDNLTGEGEGDDERIAVDLARVPANVKALVFVVNSFTGDSFGDVKNAFCRVVDTASGKEIAKYDLSCRGDHDAQIMAKLYRHNGEWKMHAIGENATGTTFHDLVPTIRGHL